jgi:hypothetical protein
MYDIRRLWLRRMAKLHTLVFTISLGVYFVLAFFDPGLLSYDLRQKFHALADETIAVTATVLGPPVQPVVTATASCDETSGTLSVELDWADDANTYTYDINRDGTPLVSGLSSSAYSDTNVVVSTTYEYEVTANGPMGPGSATSDPVSVTTPAECEITAVAPAVTIVSFDKRNVDSYDGTPRVSERRPIFTGTTSMPGATILVTIGDSFIAEFSANENGYWEWRPPYNVSSGTHTFTVTATDPDDDARQATATLRFNILKESDAAQGEGKKINPLLPPLGITGEQSSSGDAARAIDVSLSFGNEGPILQGKELKLKMSIRSLIERYNHITIPIRYSFLDQDYEIISSYMRDTYIVNGGEIEESIPIPSYMLPGDYFLQVELLFDDMNISRMIPFSVQELPLIQLASGKAISYADVVHNLGWVAFLLLFSFLSWSFLLIREFALFLRGSKAVTEYDLKKAGFIRK